MKDEKVTEIEMNDTVKNLEHIKDAVIENLRKYPNPFIQEFDLTILKLLDTLSFSQYVISHLTTDQYHKFKEEHRVNFLKKLLGREPKL